MHAQKQKNVLWQCRSVFDKTRWDGNQFVWRWNFGLFQSLRFPPSRARREALSKSPGEAWEAVLKGSPARCVHPPSLKVSDR